MNETTVTADNGWDNVPGLYLSWEERENAQLWGQKLADLDGGDEGNGFDTVPGLYMTWEVSKYA
jgi:hypothetical protein